MDGLNARYLSTVCRTEYGTLTAQVVVAYENREKNTTCSRWAPSFSGQYFASGIESDAVQALGYGTSSVCNTGTISAT